MFGIYLHPCGIVAKKIKSFKHCVVVSLQVSCEMTYLFMIARHILLSKQIKTLFSVLKNLIEIHYFCQRAFGTYTRLNGLKNLYNGGFIQIKEILISESVKNTLNSVFHDESDHNLISTSDSDRQTASKAKRY